MKEELISRMTILALEIIRLCEHLPKTEAGRIMGKQILRSSTSIGANYRSACRARSRADFISKVTVAEEEADETQYWLELLHKSGMIGKEEFDRLHTEANEVTAILVASGRTAKANATRRY